MQRQALTVDNICVTVSFANRKDPMSYQVLAQKYRPQSFDDIVGQDVIARTLKNSIEKGRVANAYIFCGPRGIGKTSAARLVAKILNCEEKKGKNRKQ